MLGPQLPSWGCSIWSSLGVKPLPGLREGEVWVRSLKTDRAALQPDWHLGWAEIEAPEGSQPALLFSLGLPLHSQAREGAFWHWPGPGHMR